MPAPEFKDVHILIVGDVILDRYVFGEVSRVSPEAPVPVVKVTRERAGLGGAANVANNVVSLGARATLVGVVGRDADAETLRRSCEAVGITAELRAVDRPTTTKTRVIGERQQLVRLDQEVVDELPSAEVEALQAELAAWLPRVDLVVLSDYGKGLVTPALAQHVIERARGSGRRVMVDPKGARWDKYRGASLVTPNLRELSDAAGAPIANEDDAIAPHAERMMARHQIEALLVTRSGKGMSYFDRTQVVHLPTQTREVFDVSGAGDTVVAALGLALASDFAVREALAVANRAAGIVVEKIGTVPATLAELKAQDAFEPWQRKLIARPTLASLLETLRAASRRIVFTNGCFDLLHRGHTTYLQRASELGDVLIVGINSDASVRRLKGEGRPVNTDRDRAHLLACLEFVDYVVTFDEDTPAPLLAQVRPDVLVKGADYSLEEVVGREYAADVRLIDLVDGYSTTSMLTRGAPR